MTLFPSIPQSAIRSPQSVRGRGATPRVEKAVELDKPNPCGRRRLRYRYRPLQRWAPEQIDLAERGLLYYFRRLGGFRLADDGLMRQFIECLDYVSEDAVELDVSPAVVLAWAIDAKADSLAPTEQQDKRFKATFRGRPDTFFAPARLDQWLDQSRECMDRRAARGRAQREAATAASRAREHARAHPPVRADRYWRLAGGERPDRRGRELSGLELRLLAFWSSLRKHHQVAAMCSQRGKDRMPKRDPYDPASDFRRDLCRIRAAKYFADATPDYWKQFANRQDAKTPEGKDHGIS